MTAIFLGVLAAGLAGWWWLPAPRVLVQRTQDQLVTLYPDRGGFHAGTVRVGVRLQDRDYRILQDRGVEVTCLEAQGRTRTSQTLLPGPGRDLGGEVRFPFPGVYQLKVLVLGPGYQRSSVFFRVQTRVDRSQ